MLEIKNLESGYGKMQVLFGVSLNVRPNEIAVLIGPNGAGKSTLLRSIFNLVDVYNGKIIFKKWLEELGRSRRRGGKKILRDQKFAQKIINKKQ